MPNPCSLDRALIESILPHRDPFLFVDQVTAFSAQQAIVAEVYLSPEWPFFRGHFPGQPTMPGVLMIEALAQTSGLLLGLTWREQGRKMQENGPLLLGKVQVKFTSLVRAGDTLRLESTFKKGFSGLFLFEVAALTGQTLAAGGEITLGRQKA
jgi:3-hydroxymyristoyl/3-hydroxydecanoyl-(acyl carrier protein) dehydratase